MPGPLTDPRPVGDRQRIAKVILDERTVARRSPQVEHERRAAIFDLTEENHFAPAGGFEGPYHLRLGIEESRLIFDVRSPADQPLTKFGLSLGPLRPIIRDYLAVSDSYYAAIKTASRHRIEAIDIGRRGLHNEGAQVLRERLVENAEIDADTARRLFTLIYALHIRG